MGIIGLLVASSVPALTGYAKQVRLKAATREVIGLLSLARSLAISSRKAKTVSVDPEHRELVIEETLDQEEPRRVRFASSVTISVQPQGQSEPSSEPARLIFQSNGSVAGRSVSLVLSNGTRTQTISVSATTGAIIVH